MEYHSNKITEGLSPQTLLQIHGPRAGQAAVVDEIKTWKLKL
jgi:hypothetical protein